MFTFDSKDPEKFCENLIQLYGAYFKDGAIKLVLELMDIGSLRDIINMSGKICGTAQFPEYIISIISRHVNFSSYQK